MSTKILQSEITSGLQWKVFLSINNQSSKHCLIENATLKNKICQTIEQF